MEKVIETLRKRPTDRSTQALLCTLIETLTDNEARAVIKIVMDENIPAPQNLFFNYETQKWRV